MEIPRRAPYRPRLFSPVAAACVSLLLAGTMTAAAGPGGSTAKSKTGHESTRGQTVELSRGTAAFAETKFTATEEVTVPTAAARTRPARTEGVPATTVPTQAQPTGTEGAPVTTVSSPPDPRRPGDRGVPIERRSRLTTSVLFLFAGLFVGALLGWLGGGFARRRGATGAPTAHPASRAVAVPEVQRSPGSTFSGWGNEGLLDGLIDGLIEGLMATYDLATTDAQRTRIVGTLRKADVHVVVPESGDTFNAAEHHALASQPAPAPDHRGTIARTERPGWRRGAAAVRLPEVTVWQ